MDTVTSRVEDELAIRTLTSRYNHAIDEGRIDDWVATFVPDGVFESSALGRSSGEAELRKFCEGYVAAFTGRHCTSDYVIEVNGDDARQRCYLTLVDNGSGQARVAVTAVYDDVLRRTPEGWRFVHRKVTPDTALH